MLKSTTADLPGLALKRAVLSDTNGDGLTDRIDSWAADPSHVLKDAAGRRDA